MKIAVSSQNKIQVTGHAGKTSRFWIFTVDPGKKTILEKELVELPKEDILHIRFHESEQPYAQHPIFNVDILLTGGAGQGFVNRLATQQVEVRITNEQDPETAVLKYLNDDLEVFQPHAHHHK
jgi:predicted Fe-Mo cluster-binding NifX family protein